MKFYGLERNWNLGIINKYRFSLIIFFDIYILEILEILEILDTKQPVMGNLFSFSSKSKNNNPRYELFLSTEQSPKQLPELNRMNQRIDAEIRLLRLDIAKQMDAHERLESRIARIDSRITELQNDMRIALHNANEKNNEKINIITKDMENLLNNDKILLDKLIEKNIVSTIQESENVL